MLYLLNAELVGDVQEAFEFEKMILEVDLVDVRKLAEIKDYSFLVLAPE
jgi:hypothetical protein